MGKRDKGSAAKVTALVVIGLLTSLYSLAEIAAALYFHSLALLSDGFHNLSDVIALLIAFWALRKSTAGPTHVMTYGWRRTEILGAVMNGCFLLALCLYTVLESIPRFIKPEPMFDGDSGLLSISQDWVFIIVAAAGLVINLVGTVVFAAVGAEHGHSHGGGDHGHSHGHKKKHKHHHKEKIIDINSSLHDEEAEVQREHDLDRDHGHSHGHSHSGSEREHLLESCDIPKLRAHINLSSSHKKHKKEKKKTDHNIRAVFLHYLGDAISSLCVLAAGLLYHFFPNEPWVPYLDPISSDIIVVIILASTIPFLKNASVILLQRAPSEISVPHLKDELRGVSGIMDVHDLHVWQLVDGMTIASVHVKIVAGSTASVQSVVSKAKRIFHEHGIHSCTLQPEFVERPLKDSENSYCLENCAVNCKEDWCCKDDEEDSTFYDTIAV